jgi:hypothetical protein
MGCGPSIRDDDGTAGDAGSTMSDDGGCRELVPCAPFEVEVTGPCRALAYFWDGIDCVDVTGCECTGPDCCRLAATYEECLETVKETCEELPFCLTCAPGTSCFAGCDHVGTVLEEWCEAPTEDCDFECICNGRGYAGSTCGGAHPQAYACVY